MILCSWFSCLDLNQAVPSLCRWKNSYPGNKNVVICQPCCFSHIWHTFVKHKKFSRMSKLLFSKQHFIYGSFFSVICRVYCSFALPHVPCWLVFVGLTVSIPIHLYCTDKSTLEIMLIFFCVLQKKKSYKFGKTWQHENIKFWMNYSFKMRLLIMVRIFPQNLDQ